MTRYIVATTSEIPPGGRKLVEVAGRSIGIFNVGGEFFALRNRCPHQGGRLCEGKLLGVVRAELPGEFDYDPSREILICPWHGSTFRTTTGELVHGPSVYDQPCYDTRTRDGFIEVRRR